MNAALRNSGIGLAGALAAVALLGSAAPAAAQQLPDSSHYQPAATTARRLDWAKFRNKRLAGEVLTSVKGQPGAVLHVVNKTGLPRTYVLGVFENPGIATTRYVVKTRARHQKVAGQGYFEMWSVFPDGSQFFSRTLDDDGPMGRMIGNSSWRDVSLPFDATGASGRPTKLVVQLVLSSNGAVDVGPLDLVETPESSP
jgi:hypothetical protein